MAAEERLREHLNQVHSCTHKLALSSVTPELIYQQNHCGVYVSSDAGDNWKDISPGDRSRHGFAIALTERRGGSLFVIPSGQADCKEHNSCIQGQLEVQRTDDGGANWHGFTKGLPSNIHACVLRDCMATDSQDRPGIYFGTTTGEVYSSTGHGETWSEIGRGLGRIQGVSSLTI